MIRYRRSVLSKLDEAKNDSSCHFRYEYRCGMKAESSLEIDTRVRARAELLTTCCLTV